MILCKVNIVARHSHTSPLCICALGSRKPRNSTCPCATTIASIVPSSESGTLAQTSSRRDVNRNCLFVVSRPRRGPSQATTNLTRLSQTLCRALFNFRDCADHLQVAVVHAARPGLRRHHLSEFGLHPPSASITLASSAEPTFLLPPLRLPCHIGRYPLRTTPGQAVLGLTLPIRTRTRTRLVSAC